MIHLGAIADDFTGATDLAVMLSRAGWRVVVCVGVPPSDFGLPPVEAVVIALKSRTAPVGQAVEDSLKALQWLQGQNCQQYFFKYCSTFDSTPRGNIGPVADALLEALQTELTVVCPAFPENKRTIYHGHLFVGDGLLSDSPMRDHPLTPMRDSSLLRILQPQTRHKVGLVNYATVSQGSQAVHERLETLRAEGVRYAVLDALDNRDLDTLGAACKTLKLVTGGSGIALGLAQNFPRPGEPLAPPLPKLQGYSAVIAGSCSQATLGQIARFGERHPSYALNLGRLSQNPQTEVEAVLQWCKPYLGAQPFLIYSSASPEKLAQTQQAFGSQIAEQIEQALAQIARGLLTQGVDKLVVAGGETSGAVVQGLGLKALAIGPEIDPGVPWTLSLPQKNLALALKSGNFGSPEFFLKAFEVLP